MARPKGKQIAVACVVCGTVRHWPPSKAIRKKFCSRECQFSGQSIVGDWSRVLSEIDHRGYLPDIRPMTPDPEDRIRVVDDRWFRRHGDQWHELKPHPEPWKREITSTPIDAADVPEVTR